MSDDINNIMEKYNEACKALKSRGLDPYNMQNGIKNTENAPKYDPNREFREGDKVSVRKIHGKLPQCRYNGMVKVKEGDCCTIHEKEHRNCYWVTIPSGGNWCFDAAYLELVTPVEEMEPYYIEESTGEITLLNKHDPIFHKSWHYSAVSAGTIAIAEAEAERDRLNAEWRKEQNND